MRAMAIFMLCFVPYGALCATKTLDVVESDVFETAGTKAEITKKAKSCISQLVRNDPIQIKDAAAGGGSVFSPIVYGTPGHSTSIAAGELFVDVDVEGGSVTANNRVDYRSSMIGHNVKSILTFLGKDGRFKIRHSNIQYLQKSTGNLHNDGYQVIYMGWGSGWKKAQAALEGVTKKIADCVMKDVEDDW